ncbi:GSCOCG00001371001-RA-CDS [Cotesia congregata]|nr:GSCOCG00001371001-RA-CDS [Cotesia congregata]
MAPVDNSPTSNMGGFELVCSSKANDTIPVHKYKSTKTGITVCIGEVDGPIVGGNFCLATQAFDDDGLPHTLEHLIFLGSEDYPYKGVLDLLGNRCLASGTNAWTDRDHTNYTMTTVGSEGFLTLMPIYLDHILFPNLTDSAYLTEVHYISGEGEDRGVVYCEMQSTENTGKTLSNTELTRAMYPGKCGYKSVTGGIMQNLRESTNNEKVKEFHRQFYRPENLTIIITGQIQHAEVFKALRPLEEKILSKGSRGPFERPWHEPIPPFTESVVNDILYPCDDEDNGIVSVGWRGPSGITEVYELTACSLLLKYLTDNSVSPIQKEFVEIDDPYCCNVDYYLTENSESMLQLSFSGVPIPKIPLVKNHLTKVLGDILQSNEVDGGIDMPRMATVIHRHQLETLSSLENMPHDAITYMLIGDALYGRDVSDLEQRLNTIEDLKKLGKEPASFWINLLKKYLIDAPSAVINATPSIDKQKEMDEQEKKRIAERIKQLGKEGLEEKEKAYLEAVKQNDAPIPDEVLSSVPVPGTDSINFHHIRSYTTGGGDQHPRLDVNKLSLFTYLDHVNTNFAYLFVVMDTLKVPKEARPYMPLILEAIGECPINREGELVPYEDVVAELEADTIAVSLRMGFESPSRFTCGAYSHSVNLMLQLELSKYPKGVQWIKELLYDTKFTPERLKIISSKLLNELTQCKKAGNKITGDLMRGLIYSKESNHFNSSLLRQQQFLTKLATRLGTPEGQAEVVAEVEAVMKILTAKDHMILYMATNVDKLSAQVTELYKPWWTFFNFDNFDTFDKNKLNVTPDWKLMNPREEIPLEGCVLGLGCVESAYLSQTGPCLNDFESPDLAPLLVCLQYLTQVEGPMWRQVRGQGFAYGCNLYAKPNEGLLYLTFYASTDVIGAYKETKAIVSSLITENSWERLLYDSAKSSLIFEIVEREKSVGDAVSQSLLSYFKNVFHDYNRSMVQKIYTVSIKDLNRVANKYIKPLFDPKQCKTTIVCTPSKVAEIANAFKGFSQNLKVFNTLESSYLNEW